MESKGIIRKIDKLGRICLPIDYRRQHDMAVDDVVEVVNMDEGLLIVPHELRCGCCGGKDGVRDHNGGLLCEACIALAKRLGRK